MKYDDVRNARYGDRLHDAEGIYHSRCKHGPKPRQRLNHVQFRDFYVSFFSRSISCLFFQKRQVQNCLKITKYAFDSPLFVKCAFYYVCANCCISFGVVIIYVTDSSSGILHPMKFGKRSRKMHNGRGSQLHSIAILLKLLKSINYIRLNFTEY